MRWSDLVPIIVASSIVAFVALAFYASGKPSAQWWNERSTVSDMKYIHTMRTEDEAQH